MLETAIHYEDMQTPQSNNTQEKGEQNETVSLADDEPGLEDAERSPGTQKVVTHALVYSG